MTAMVPITPTRTGAASAGTAVTASDTITAAVLGKGALLEILNGSATPDTVTISDGSTTPSGAAAAANAPSVTNGTNKVFLIRPEQLDPVTGLVTVTHSQVPTVTYKLYPLP